MGQHDRAWLLECLLLAREHAAMPTRHSLHATYASCPVTPVCAACVRSVHQPVHCFSVLVVNTMGYVYVARPFSVCDPTRFSVQCFSNVFILRAIPVYAQLVHS